MTFRLDMPTFAGGEIGPETIARFDTAKYRTALARSRNCLLAPTGGAYGRPGLQYVGRTKSPDTQSRLIPFQFSVDQGYALELGHLTLRIVYQGGYVLKPDVQMQAVSLTNPMVVTSAAHGVTAGEDIYFSGIIGMVELNNQVGRVLAVIDADHYSVDIDATAFTAFISSSGVLGTSAGGAGGLPPPPTVTTPAPPFEDTTTPPFTLPGFGEIEP